VWTPSLGRAVWARWIAQLKSQVERFRATL
jgi:hypothetical protein